jgi:hypothetical protein
MTILDEYEHRRGPVKRRKFRGKPRPDPKEVQLQMKLMGGLTPGEKKRGTPFDDPISF